MPAAPSNTTGAYASVRGSLALEMETFDQLPPVLRQALRDGAVKWSAIGVARMVGPLLDLPGMDRWQAEQLEMLEREELRSFATLHLRRHGYLLPHVAADVSVLRTRDAPPVRRPRPLVMARWRRRRAR